MFTGIIETTSEVGASAQRADVTSLTIIRPEAWELSVGQSIAVNGVCLTVTSFDSNTFSLDMVEETLAKTSFGERVPGHVNLERAMPATGRFEGHIVQGHVDTVGRVTTVPTEMNNWILILSYDKQFDNLVVPKGSITIDGVSLTVVNPAPGQLSVALIPHTLENTTLGTLTEGGQVNLEFDIVGKYLQKQAV